MIAKAGRMKILVIDDERGPRESLRMLLNRDYDVLLAADVDQGVSMLKAEQPDLIVMDIRMPGKTGIDGLREIREIDKQVSIIMLTGFGALETAREALRLGANEYITKPFDAGEMRSLVGRFAQRSMLERRRTRMKRELQDMNSKLVEDLASKERLATLGQSSSEFAHDLRNPLMIVMGYVSLLNQQLEDSRVLPAEEYEQASAYLGIIDENVRRCCELANMWQQMSAGDLGAFQPTPVAQVLNDLMVGVEPLVSTAEVDVEYRIDPGDAHVNGSRAQLLRAIHNLVSNAIDAVDPGSGHIVLTCERKADSVEISVADNGCGMAEDVRERMFEPYFTTKGKDKGTGLGTAICRRIVEEHGGTIEAESAPGAGTTIRVSLPILKRSIDKVS